MIHAAGLQGLRLHDLRHSFASVGAGGGLGLPTARYAHLDADPMRRAVDIIGHTIGAAMKRKPSAEVVSIKRTMS